MAVIDELKHNQLHANQQSFDCFVYDQTFTRPNDAIAYVQDDQIANSTSAPTPQSQDLTPQGAYAGCTIQIWECSVRYTTAEAAGNTALLYSGSPFTISNDNAYGGILGAGGFDLDTGYIIMSSNQIGFSAQFAHNNTTVATLNLPTGVLYTSLVMLGAGRPAYANATIRTVVRGRII